MSIFYPWNEGIVDVDEDVRREAIDARRRQARHRGPCSECMSSLGHRNGCPEAPDVECEAQTAEVDECRGKL